MAITKIDFMRGIQCRKMLWLDKHKPSLKIIPTDAGITITVIERRPDDVGAYSESGRDPDRASRH